MGKLIARRAVTEPLCVGKNYSKKIRYFIYLFYFILESPAYLFLQRHLSSSDRPATKHLYTITIKHNQLYMICAEIRQ
jgi:hypothetical protein